MSSGTVVRFSSTTGYGFITPDEGGDDVFLHASLLPEALKDSIPLGTRVEYDAAASDRGPKAVGVRILSVPRTEQSRRVEQDERLCDVLSASVFAQKVTEVLIDAAPTVTGAQIAEVRKRLQAFARQHGWID